MLSTKEKKNIRKNPQTDKKKATTIYSNFFFRAHRDCIKLSVDWNLKKKKKVKKGIQKKI